MNDTDFSKEYHAIVERALLFSEKARREGLVALEDKIDEIKYNQRDILEYGLRLIIDRTDTQIINKILTNIINLETDNDKKTLKTIQKEAVLAIQEGQNLIVLLLVMNSYVTIDIEETMKKYNKL